MDRSRMVGPHHVRLVGAVMEVSAKLVQMPISLVANQDIEQWFVLWHSDSTWFFQHWHHK